MSKRKPIDVDIHFMNNELLFMFTGKEFRRMMRISKKKYIEIIGTIPGDTKRKCARFWVIDQEHWNEMMRDALEVMDMLIYESLKEYELEHNTEGYEYLFGYCEKPDFVYLSYSNAGKKVFS